MRRYGYTINPDGTVHAGEVTNPRYVGPPDNVLEWKDPYDTDWALPDFAKKPTPWLLLGALAVGAYVWSRS